MNYIKSLQKNLEEAKKEIEVLRSGISDLKAYMNHPKFQGFENHFVNPDDVISRLNETINNADSVQFEG